jgi:ribosomal protein L37E
MNERPPVPREVMMCPRCQTEYFEQTEDGCDWCGVPLVTQIPDDTVKESER